MNPQQQSGTYNYAAWNDPNMILDQQQGTMPGQPQNPILAQTQRILKALMANKAKLAASQQNAPMQAAAAQQMQAPMQGGNAPAPQGVGSMPPSAGQQNPVPSVPGSDGGIGGWSGGGGWNDALFSQPPISGMMGF